jgi:uncharacterized repeat protein (TIGR03809 family)
MPARLDANPYGELAQKWRDLAERRRQHFIELYRSGRWRLYYTDEQFLARMREVVSAHEAWARLAPTRRDPPQAAE